MGLISKAELKEQLHKLGINIVKGRYVLKKDIHECLAGDVLEFKPKTKPTENNEKKEEINKTDIDKYNRTFQRIDETLRKKRFSEYDWDVMDEAISDLDDLIELCSDWDTDILDTCEKYLEAMENRMKEEIAKDEQLKGKEIDIEKKQKVEKKPAKVIKLKKAKKK